MVVCVASAGHDKSTVPRRATTQWTRGTAVARKEKYPVSPYLEFRPHWKADFFLPEVTGWGLTQFDPCQPFAILVSWRRAVTPATGPL